MLRPHCTMETFRGMTQDSWVKNSSRWKQRGQQRLMFPTSRFTFLDFNCLSFLFFLVASYAIFSLHETLSLQISLRHWPLWITNFTSNWWDVLCSSCRIVDTKFSRFIVMEWHIWPWMFPAYLTDLIASSLRCLTWFSSLDVEKSIVKDWKTLFLLFNSIFTKISLFRF